MRAAIAVVARPGNCLVNSVAKRAKSNDLVMILTAASILDATLHAGELENISQRLKNAA